ncbi:MAG: hypothetical protein U0R17_01865 [Acidimicrobiia bacterium]
MSDEPSPGKEISLGDIAGLIKPSIAKTIVDSIRQMKTLTPIDYDEFEELAQTIIALDEQTRNEIVAGLSVIVGGTVPNSPSSRLSNPPLFQDQRVALALVARVEIGFFPTDRIRQQLVDSYSAKELISLFHLCVPPKIIPEVLAWRAYEDRDGLDPDEYDALFDPSSKEMSGLSLEDRSKFAKRFLIHLEVQLRGVSGEGGLTSREKIAKIFRKDLQKFPDFNRDILNELNPELTSLDLAQRDI